jgi:hypothetical protein
LSIADFLRRIFGREAAPAESSPPEGTHVEPVTPPTSGVPPTAPLEHPGPEDGGPPPAE